MYIFIYLNISEQQYVVVVLSMTDFNTEGFAGINVAFRERKSYQFFPYIHVTENEIPKSDPTSDEYLIDDIHDKFWRFCVWQKILRVVPNLVKKVWFRLSCTAD
jgi:hypothetical protein